MRQHWQSAVAAVAVLAALVGLTACGSSKKSSSQPSPTSTASGVGAPKLTPSPANKGKKVTIGSKNFTEEFILGQIYAQALKAAGYNVKTQLNLGSETIGLKAIQDGQISGYPEYTSTVLESFECHYNLNVGTDDDDTMEACTDQAVAFGHWLARLGYFYTRYEQARFRRLSCQAMQSL